MKIKERIENHFKEHKREIFTAAVGGVMLAAGFGLGKAYNFNCFTKGLEMCFEVKPELEPMLWEAIDLVKKNRG